MFRDLLGQFSQMMYDTRTARRGPNQTRLIMAQLNKNQQERRGMGIMSDGERGVGMEADAARMAQNAYSALDGVNEGIEQADQRDERRNRARNTAFNAIGAGLTSVLNFVAPAAMPQAVPTDAELDAVDEHLMNTPGLGVPFEEAQAATEEPEAATEELPGLMAPRPALRPVDLTDPATIQEAQQGDQLRTFDDLLADEIYDDFAVKGEEGTEHHVGQDNKNITLRGGVVPDGLVYDGNAFTQRRSVVSNFDASKLDTSGAYYTYDGTTYRRSDYESDDDFVRALVGASVNLAAKEAGDNWNNMSDGSKKAIVKIGWNKGPGWFRRETTQAIYDELGKDNPNPANLYSRILVGSTVEGGGASIGIAKARANAWNSTIEATGGTEITRIVADNSGDTTKFKYYDKDKNLLYTEVTSRSPTLYENKSKVVQKNRNGEW